MPSKVEDKTQSHTDQVARLTDEVQSLRRELRRAQRLATVGTMAAMVAHEFNNILTPIINYAQLAKTNPKMVEKAITKASEGGLRAAEICKAILGITRECPPESSREELAPLVADTIAAMGREPSKDAIELVVAIPEGLAITTRRLELQQVLLNLVINARTSVMASNSLRKIEISATTDSHAIVLSVSDNGMGIAPELIDKIFDPFFTTASEDNDRQGHGLGLAICKEIITSMDGNITVTSTLGQGATFTIRLPDMPIDA